jgi:hypothetical protein
LSTGGNITLFVFVPKSQWDPGGYKACSIDGRRSAASGTLIASKPWSTAPHCKSYGDASAIGDDNEETTFPANEALTSRVLKDSNQATPCKSGKQEADWFNCTGEKEQWYSASQPDEGSK